MLNVDSWITPVVKYARVLRNVKVVMTVLRTSKAVAENSKLGEEFGRIAPIDAVLDSPERVLDDGEPRSIGHVEFQRSHKRCYRVTRPLNFQGAISTVAKYRDCLCVVVREPPVLRTVPRE